MMRSWMTWGLAVAMTGAVAACEVEDPPTEVSVDNRSIELAEVTLSDATGGSVSFGEVPSASSTAYIEVPFVAVRQLTVEVEGGTAQGGTVDLTSGFQHTLTLSDDAPPVILVISPPSGGRDPGGTPAPGDGGW